jgi:hypothetical protein
MRKLIADEWITLDGVVQGPSSPKEDPSGSFEHCGWHTSYFDEPSMQWTHANVVSRPPTRRRAERRMTKGETKCAR